MGMMDKLKGMLGQRSGKADERSTRTGDAFDERTGDPRSEHVDTAPDATRDPRGGDPSSGGDAR